MEDRLTEGFLNLERNLEAMVHEGIVKLGYRRGEQISIYYDYDLLVYLLNIEEAKDNPKYDIMPNLQEFLSFIQKNWGKVTIELENNRYKFILSAFAVSYVHIKNKDNTFLSDLINVISKKDCNLDEILKVFRNYSEEVVSQESTNLEFDYVVYFKDTTIDEFKYCFTFGELGKYYHRLTDYDYNNLLNG